MQAREAPLPRATAQIVRWGRPERARSVKGLVLAMLPMLALAFG